MSGRSERVSEIRLGALYKFGALRQIRDDLMISLMVERSGLGETKAKQLLAHWKTTEKWKEPNTTSEWLVS